MLKDDPGPDPKIMYTCSKDLILQSLGLQKSILVDVHHHLDHKGFCNNLFVETGIFACFQEYLREINAKSEKRSNFERGVICIRS
jgi:hypothetical protein